MLQRKNAARAWLVGLIALVLSVTACTAAVAPTPAQSAHDSVAIDELATINVSPVDYDGIRVVTAIFSEILEGRATSLQQLSGTDWKDLGEAKQGRYGEVQFQTEASGDSPFRVVAHATQADGASKDEVSTRAATPGEGWKSTLSTDFDGDKLDQTWASRNSGIYTGNGHHCAAPYPSNVKVADGQVLLSVTAEREADNISKAKEAGCEEPGVFRDAAISTEQRHSVKQGIVAARVKFPESQGMHGSVWLQSYHRSEIDMIESYGYGSGITSVIHVNGKRTPSAGKDTYVLTDEVQDKEWWSKFHVYSVEWDNTAVVFRVDGVETKRIDQVTPDTEYFVVISMGTSDWEQKRFEDPVEKAEDVEPGAVPQSMAVDWVKIWEPA